VANIAGLVSNSLMGVVMDHFHSPQIAMCIFAGCLLLSSLLVIALPAKIVNR
jgi:nitrate/nitrite transporter NarK